VPTPAKIFISYSHKDEDWKDRLVSQLETLSHQLLLDPWNDRKIKGGDEWETKIREAMAAADVALLLVSQNSLNSKFIRETEVPYLMERRERENITIIPVICKACFWQEVPEFAKLQAHPRDGRPLASFRGHSLDAEFIKIGKELLDIVRKGEKPSSASPPSTGTRIAALHQLPSPPADFTGRKEDLDALRSALPKAGSLAIFGLRGTGGVGKTTLALKLAEELTSQYPDAQIYLDLKGVDPHPLTTVQAMAHVVRSFQPETRIPESDTELGSLYRSVLHGKKALLLMDNASGKDQVKPLIPPAGSLLLVTSRSHFVLPGMIPRNLDELEKEDACALLLSIASRIGEKADEIASLCGRLPLALRLAGSALAERSDLPVPEYIRRLKEGKEQFGEVDASLNLSYELLTEDSRRLWRMLGVFPGTFNAEAAAAVWDLEIDSSRDRLGELVGRSLVEWEEQERRYRLHDLAREFARRQLVDPEKDLAASRHAKYFVDVLWQTDYLYLEGGEKVLQGLKISDSEWGNIQAGQAWAASKFQEKEDATKLCSEYPDAGTYYLAIRQNPPERIGWRKVALEAARRINDLEAEGRHLGTLGNAYLDLGEPRRAIEFYEQVLTITREVGDRCGEGSALGNLGIAYSDLGEPQRAIEFCEQDLAIAREIGDRRGEGMALGYLGNAYSDLGEPRRAIEFYEQHLAITRETGDRGGEGMALGNLGNVYSHLGDSRRAIEFHEQHLAITRETGDRRGEGIASWNLGLVYEKEGNLARAIDLMQTCVDYERKLGHPDAEKDAAFVESLRARIDAPK
jgi:tetratricopeptide (TPR) repeat protein